MPIRRPEPEAKIKDHKTQNTFSLQAFFAYKLMPGVSSIHFSTTCESATYEFAHQLHPALSHTQTFYNAGYTEAPSAKPDTGWQQNTFAMCAV